MEKTFFVAATSLLLVAVLMGCTHQQNEAINPEPEEVTVHGVRSSNAKPGSQRRTVRGVLAMPDTAPAPAPVLEQHRDDFEDFEANPVKQTREHPVSTFSSDVDTASYSYVRRRINHGRLPEKSAVRLEEMLNYFDYAYEKPTRAEEPFKANILVHDSPWAKNRKLIHIGIQGYELEKTQQPDSNLVFLLDVSGSMNSQDKLPLVKQSLNLLLNQLKPDDTVAIVVYAGAAGTVLEPTKVKYKSRIKQAMNKLQAGGSTAGAHGIELAYQLAEENFKPEAVNRILLATDGDFNVGITDREQLKGYVERKREKGIYLSILGFGQGNYHDHMMQTLAQNGNGVAAYIDTLSEAQKVLVHEATSSLFPIATDLKLQVEFNPKNVSEYRLLGYETRALKREDFKNDKVDAGDIGSGHSVTAIYEVALTGSGGELIEELRYGDKKETESETHLKDELAYLKIRYKLPGAKQSVLREFPIYEKSTAAEMDMELMQQEANFAAAVAGFAQLLTGGKYLEDWGLEDVLELAKANRGEDEYGYRSEFLGLVRMVGILGGVENSYSAFDPKQTSMK